MSAVDDSVRAEELQTLLEVAVKNAYKAKDSDSKSQAILNNCLKLFSRDYKTSVVSNYNGELCSHYPALIPVLEYASSQDSSPDNGHVEAMYNVAHLRELFNKARFSRCRARFAVPVILYEGKHICRGATLSGGAEIYGRTGFDFFFTGGGSIPLPDMEGNAVGENNEWQLFNRIRGQDIKLLKTFSVSYIVDLMVEKKKVKFGMNVTSSEKVDKENRYSDFNILSVPYPGCEFFRSWRDSGYRAEELLFDWKQGYVDALLDLPGRISPPRDVDWTKYRKWDLVQLTQNYLKLLLHYIKQGDSGILIHCISGWDRTPLFIALLRLSLWADGMVHESLNAEEILYLTIAYDWYLFGHNFPDRIDKGEDIFFFCFYFLKYICSDDFSVGQRPPRRRSLSRTESEGLIDGVLLDAEIPPVEPSELVSAELHSASHKSSNSSISSSSSAKSNVDHPPLNFIVGSPEEDFFVNGSALSNKIAVAPPSRQVTGTQRVDSRSVRIITQPCNVTGVEYNATSPMAVPNPLRKTYSDARTHSPSYGSWQLISGSGSLRGSASTSSQGSHRSAPTAEEHTSVDQDTLEPETARKQRLEAVRRTFLTAYSSIMPIGPEVGGANGSGIASLLGNFAEKVGIKQSKSAVV